MIVSLLVSQGLPWQTGGHQRGQQQQRAGTTTGGIARLMGSKATIFIDFQIMCNFLPLFDVDLYVIVTIPFFRVSFKFNSYILTFIPHENIARTDRCVVQDVRLYRMRHAQERTTAADH